MPAQESTLANASKISSESRSLAHKFPHTSQRRAGPAIVTAKSFPGCFGTSSAHLRVAFGSRINGPWHRLQRNWHLNTPRGLRHKSAVSLPRRVLQAVLKWEYASRRSWPCGQVSEGTSVAVRASGE